MKTFKWDSNKNRKLISERNISFEEIVDAIIQGNLLGAFENPNYPGQEIWIVKIRGNAVAVPCKILEKEIFLITAYPSRKYTKLFLEHFDD